MFALDTNVVSEITRHTPHPSVMQWLDTVPRTSLFLPTVVIGELYAGVELMALGKRRQSIQSLLFDFIASVGPSNIIDFGVEEAAQYARILADRQKQGRRIMIADAQVAASAASRNLPVVTRNIRDFEHCGIEVINPWEAVP
jgi:predicted nucleic acid-binding protein